LAQVAFGLAVLLACTAFALVQSVTGMRRLVASERVKCRAAMTSLAAPVMRPLRMKSPMAGIATAIRRPAIASTTISSSSVNPDLRPLMRSTIGARKTTGAHSRRASDGGRRTAGRGVLRKRYVATRKRPVTDAKIPA
jgi:hypothetical protein